MVQTKVSKESHLYLAATCQYKVIKAGKSEEKEEYTQSKTQAQVLPRQ